MMVLVSTTVQSSSFPLLLAFASIFWFNIWTLDITQAYLQSVEPLSRDIFFKNPAPEFELDPDHFFKLLRPLYEVCDASDLYHINIDRHHREDLEMTPLFIDPALYYRLADGVLKGLSGGYVDYLLRCGDPDFWKVSRNTKQKFEMKDESPMPFDFAGYLITKDNDLIVLIDQKGYLRRL